MNSVNTTADNEGRRANLCHELLKHFFLASIVILLNRVLLRTDDCYVGIDPEMFTSEWFMTQKSMPTEQQYDLGLHITTTFLCSYMCRSTPYIHIHIDATGYSFITLSKYLHNVKFINKSGTAVSWHN